MATFSMPHRGCGGVVEVSTSHEYHLPASFKYDCDGCSLRGGGAIEPHWVPSKRGYMPQDELGLAWWRVAVAITGVVPVYFGHYGSEDSRDIDLLVAFRDKIPEAMKEPQFWAGQYARFRVDPTVVAISGRKVKDIFRDETEFSIPVEDIQNCIHQTVGANLMDCIPPERRDIEAKRRQLLAYAQLPTGGLTAYERGRHDKRLVFVFAQYVALLQGEDAGYTKARVEAWARPKGMELRYILYPADGVGTALGDFKATIQKVAETGRLTRWGLAVRSGAWREPLVYAPSGPGWAQHDPSLDGRCAVCGSVVHGNPYPLSKHDAWTGTEILCEDHAEMVEDDYEFQFALLEAEEGNKWGSETSVVLHRRGESLLVVEVNWGFTSSGSPSYGQSRIVKIPLPEEE